MMNNKEMLTEMFGVYKVLIKENNKQPRSGRRILSNYMQAIGKEQQRKIDTMLRTAKQLGNLSLGKRINSICNEN